MYLKLISYTLFFFLKLLFSTKINIKYVYKSCLNNYQSVLLLKIYVNNLKKINLLILLKTKTLIRKFYIITNKTSILLSVFYFIVYCIYNLFILLKIYCIYNNSEHLHYYSSNLIKHLHSFQYLKILSFFNKKYK